jgi:hypothetical protein
MTDLNEFFRKHHQRRDDFRSAPAIVCTDGLTLSVQASLYHYCSPRNSAGPWHEVEVGFPSAKCPELMEWCESPETPLRTVYGYVPIDVVEKLIDAHGGIKEPALAAAPKEPT